MAGPAEVAERPGGGPEARDFGVAGEGEGDFDPAASLRREWVVGKA